MAPLDLAVAVDRERTPQQQRSGTFHDPGAAANMHWEVDESLASLAPSIPPATALGCLAAPVSTGRTDRSQEPRLKPAYISRTPDQVMNQVHLRLLQLVRLFPDVDFYVQGSRRRSRAPRVWPSEGFTPRQAPRLRIIFICGQDCLGTPPRGLARGSKVMVAVIRLFPGWSWTVGAVVEPFA